LCSLLYASVKKNQNNFMVYKFKSKIWIYPGQAAWHFVNVPKKESKEIKKLFAGHKRGFGSLKVEAKIGDTTWATSVFPDSKSETYLLPIKSQVRKKENLVAGKSIAVTMLILV